MVGQGPEADRITVAIPEEIVGVNVVVSEFGFENVPEGDIQRELVAEPPMVPFKVMLVVPHVDRFTPASTVGVEYKVTVSVSDKFGQLLLRFTVNVYVPALVVVID